MERDLDTLASRMKTSDEEAVRDFAVEVGPRLRGFFIHFGMSPAEAESLATTCITDAWLKLDRFESRGPGSFEAWIFSLAKHAWVNEMRRCRGWRALALTDDIPDVGPEDLAAGPSPGLEVKVAEAMTMLSETDCAIIRLRYFEGPYSYEEIGRMLNLTAGTARVRHHRAIRQLEALLVEFQPRDRGTSESHSGVNQS